MFCDNDEHVISFNTFVLLTAMSVPNNLFEGNISSSHRSELLYFQWRIASAVNSFPRNHSDPALARRRWLIGLFYEVVGTFCFL